MTLRPILPLEMLSEIVNHCENSNTLDSLSKTSKEIGRQAREKFLTLKLIKIYGSINKALEIAVIRTRYSFKRCPLNDEKSIFWKRQCSNLISFGADINYSSEGISIIRLVNDSNDTSIVCKKSIIVDFKKLFLNATIYTGKKTPIYLCMNHGIRIDCDSVLWCIQRSKDSPICGAYICKTTYV